MSSHVPFRALRATCLWTIGAKNFVVETDAKYIKGMINNPDIQPTATINHWITGILLFTFKLVHVAGERCAPDGISRRKRSPEDEEDINKKMTMKIGSTVYTDSCT